MQYIHGMQQKYKLIKNHQMQGVAEVASQSHKLKVGGSSPPPASK